jgi:hypothetical protein
MSRGRPRGQMTHRRRQVLKALADASAQGERLSFANIARRCGLYDYREARRIVNDLRRLKDDRVACVAYTALVN